MTEANPPRRVGRSILAILAGMIVVVVLSLGTDLALHAAGVFPVLGAPMSDTLFLLATAYRTVYAVAGGYVTAWLAPNQPMKHALINGLIGFALSILGAVLTWNKALGPHWYPLALVVTAVPTAWLGAELRLMQLRDKPA
jgi:hypothetical protein